MMMLKEQWLIAAQNIRSFTGHFDAKIGTKTEENYFRSMGAFRIWHTTLRRDRLIDFAKKHKLIIANALFQKPKNRYLTWGSLDGEKETKHISH